MLEVHSPVPLTEGESLVLGISTKHVLHFIIGLAISSPIVLVGYFVLPHFGMPKFFAIGLGVGIGALFAMVPVKNRPLAEFMWLTTRYKLRPKTIMYDREYRIRVHREEDSKEGLQ